MQREKGRRAEIQRLFEVYKTRTDLHNVSNVAVAAAMNISSSTASRWSISEGHSSHRRAPAKHHNRHLIEAELDRRMLEGNQVPDRYLSRKYECSRFLVCKIRQEKGYPPCERPRKKVEHVPAWQSAFFDRWKRPNGIDSHLRYLSDNQT